MKVSSSTNCVKFKTFLDGSSKYFSTVSIICCVSLIRHSYIFQPLCSKLQTMNYEATTLGTARTVSILQ